MAPASGPWVIGAGLVLGYSARLAFGCNVGAYFSGIASGSLHGWVWFASRSPDRCSACACGRASD
jgi:hypothetical protein